jgi:hypothetical protein
MRIMLILSMRNSEDNSPEISLPSSIALQQFFSGHNFSFQNTTALTWLKFLQGTTPQSRKQD